MTFKIGLVCLLTLSVSACEAQENTSKLSSKNTWCQPAISSTWHWQLQGEINPNLPVDIYDIDLFDSSAEFIKTLHDNGKKVICYFSAGSYENWRDDAKAFDKKALGLPLDDWKGERWLDVRATSLKSIMSARLDLAQHKKCDGVEPDNVDGYANKSGFALTGEDQIAYNIWLAEQAHARGLSIGLKNDLDQVEQLVEHFDFAVNEQCFEYEECERLVAFIQAGKAVFNAEYKKAFFDNKQLRIDLCQQTKTLEFSTLLLSSDLSGGQQFSCF